MDILEREEGAFNEAGGYESARKYSGKCKQIHVEYLGGVEARRTSTKVKVTGEINNIYRRRLGGRGGGGCEDSRLANKPEMERTTTSTPQSKYASIANILVAAIYDRFPRRKGRYYVE